MDQQDGRTTEAASDLNRLSTTGKSFLLDPDSRRGIIQELQTRLKAEQQKRRDLLLLSSNNVSQAATSSSTTEVAQQQQMDNSKLLDRDQMVAPSASASPPKQNSPLSPGAEKLATAPVIINTSCQTYPRGAKELVTAPVINGETYRDKTVRAETMANHNLEEKVFQYDRIISEGYQSAQSAGGEGRKSYGEAEDVLTPNEDRVSIDQMVLGSCWQSMLVKPVTVTAASEMSAPPATAAAPKSTNPTPKLLLFMKSAVKPATTQVESSMKSADTSGTPTWLEKHLRAPGSTVPNPQAVTTPTAITPMPPNRTTALPCLQCLMRSLQESGLLGSCWHAAVVELEEAFAIKNLAEATIGKSEASAGGESLNQMLLPVNSKKDAVSSSETLRPASQHDVNKWKALEKLCFLRNSLLSCSHHSA